MKLFRIVLLSLLLASVCTSMTVNAQEKEEDFAVWGYATINKHVVSGLTVSLSGEIWSTNTAKNVGLWWIHPSVSFKFNDYFSLLAGYRYFNSYSYSIDEMGEQISTCTPGHRWYAGGSLGIGIGPVKIALREMIEQIYNRPKGEEGSERSFLRSRIKVDLKMASLPVAPYAEVENFLDIINDTDNKGKTGIMRYSVGTMIPFAKIHAFDIFYRYQHYYNSKKPHEHILGLGYVVSF